MSNVTGLTNPGALNTIGNLKKHTSAAADATAALASGSKLTKASKDAASAAISALMKSNISVLNQAKTNANNAIGLIQVAAGGLNNIKDLATSLKTLAVKATDGSLDDNKRAMINNEFIQTSQQIDDVASRTRWNGVSLLNGSNGGGTIPAANTANQGIFNVAAPTANTMANSLNASSRGFISGTVKSVNVTGSVGAYDVTLVVTSVNGDQTFEAKGIDPVANTTLNLVSIVDTGSVIKLDYDATATTGISSPATFKSAIETVLNVGTGLTPATIQSVSGTTGNDLTSLSVSSNTAPGLYAFRYDANSNKLTLTNGVQKWEKAVSADGVQSVTFDNGITASLGSAFARNTGIAQVLYNVAASSTSSVSLTFQLAEQVTDTLKVDISGANRTALLLTGLSVATAGGAQSAQSSIDNALNSLNSSYAVLGAQQKRLESTINNLETQVENLTAARSNYEDADIAATMTEYVQASTMSTIAQSALAFNQQMTRQLAGIVQG